VKKRIIRLTTALTLTALAVLGVTVATSLDATPQSDTGWGAPDTSQVPADTGWGTPPTDTPQSDTGWG